MNEHTMIRARMLADGRVARVFPDGSTAPFEDQSDYAALAEMSEEDIEANALADEDN